MVVSVTVTRRTDPAVFSRTGMEISESVYKPEFLEVLVESVFPIFKECIPRHVVRFQEVQIAANHSTWNRSNLKSGFQTFEESLLSFDLEGARIPCRGINRNDLDFCSMS
jgi:hypothetical protein